MQGSTAPTDPPGELLAAVERVVAGWITRSVMSTAEQQTGVSSPALRAAAERAGEEARSEIVAEMATLLATDVDAQRANPLAVLRTAVRHATAVLRAAQIPEVPRDEFARRAFPDDVYALVPATWADVDPSLVEPGVTWGAWKAATVLQRRRAEGRR